MAAPSEIEKLVEHFDRNREQYLSPGYNETQLRQEFLNPFFSALGWDMENRAGVAEPYKEVIHEDAIKIGGERKAPDYGFRVGRDRKFFVEAKKPSVNIREDVTPAFQLRRYAWTAKLPLSILSDFQEFAVYDCRIKPSKTDKATTARINYLEYHDYIPKWDEIFSVFSRDAAWQGSFDKYVVDTKGKKGADEVDEAFLKDIESWRNVLSRNIALRNPKLTVHELNFAVQRTIDRIIFLRICEDRGVETYGTLRALVNGEQTYKRMQEVFYRADERYNSGLFQFSAEKGRPEGADELTLSLAIDDKPLKEIIGNLYYPDCPYEFSVFPADILGQVYEQFLGKVIRLTAGHQAKVEEKPEVKKAGGVYYTPTYIVDYIVKNTVGKLIEGKTPKQVAPLHILDPACGSGSFLIGAYQCLLDWHRDWYVKDDTTKWSTGKDPIIYQAKGDDWRLTTSERKRILLNNIYGVDIDSQAVEVTKLSLLLKVLEGENEQSISQQLKMFHERALPDLDSNIKCGNSLIGNEFYQKEQLDLLDDEQKYRINVFDWSANFPEILREGGFDVVIGNPPYIRIQAMKEWAPIEVEFYKSAYESASTGNYDIYVVFVERGIWLLRSNGRFGFILPHKFFNAQYGRPLRSLISRNQILEHVVHFGEQQVFSEATTYTCLMFLTKGGNTEVKVEHVSDIDAWRGSAEATSRMIPSGDISGDDWHFSADPSGGLIARLQQKNAKLGSIAHIFVGTQTSADDVYVLDNCKIAKGVVMGYSQSLEREVSVEKDLAVLFLRGKDIRRYDPPLSTAQLICPYEIQADTFELLGLDRLRREYPLGFAYLEENESFLAKREKGRFKGDKWYAYAYPKSMTLFRRRKIVVPDYNNVASFTLDERGHFYKTGYGILIRDEKHSLEYVLGLLNSKLLFRVLRFIGTSLRGGYVRFWTQYLEKLPIRLINFADPADKVYHDRMVGMVDSILKLHRDLAIMKTDQEKTVIQRQIDATDKQIDALVYELYGLTEVETEIVESQYPR